MTAPFEEDREPRLWRFGRWRVGARWWQHWREWFGKDYNWRNFTLLEIAFEAGPAEGYKGRYVEFTVGLLGFVGEVEIFDAVDRAAALSPVERRMQDWEERHGP